MFVQVNRCRLPGAVPATAPILINIDHIICVMPLPDSAPEKSEIVVFSDLRIHVTETYDEIMAALSSL